jgi:ribosomal subunit interface protein
MNISFAFKNFDPSEHLKKYGRRRIEKLGRFFGKSAGLDINVVMTVDKFRNLCEVNVSGEGLHINASEDSNDDMYAAIDLVTDKVESQIKRKVSRVKEQRRKERNADINVFTYNVEAEDENDQQIVGTERFAPKPLHIDEALMQLDSIGSDFLVFLNAENDRVNVIYKRRVSGYALIDPIL